MPLCFFELKKDFGKISLIIYILAWYNKGGLLNVKYNEKKI